jgi:2-polyprenyl-3-methyl-5-hydroxy-6-metoxy-1,4-benzoquinol methylase
MNQTKLEDYECNICKNKKGFKLITIKKSYNIYYCPSCGVYFVYPQPSEKELRRIYSFDEGYFESAGFNKESIHPEVKRRIISLKNKQRKKKENFLDVGCGTGEAVYFADKIGFNALGLEINDGAVKRMKTQGINVKNSTLENFNGKVGSFDAIYLGDIIEHVKNPSGFLDRCNALLVRGGRILISTPNADSFISKYQLQLTHLFGIPWGHISPPHHLFEFSEKNLGKLLKLKGFKIKEIKFNRSPFAYSIGNTGLFDNFKKEYRKSKSFIGAWNKNGFSNNVTLSGVIFLYSLGYFLDLMLTPFLRNNYAMVVLAEKL